VAFQLFFNVSIILERLDLTTMNVDLSVVRAVQRMRRRKKKRKEKKSRLRYMHAGRRPDNNVSVTFSKDISLPKLCHL